MAETNGTAVELGGKDAEENIKIEVTEPAVKSEKAIDSPTKPSPTKANNVTAVELGGKDAVEDIKIEYPEPAVKSEKAIDSPTKPSPTKARENVSSGDPPSTLEKQLIRQIEYYFGDVNLPKDKFLLEQVKLDDGWVPLEVMFKFKRLASFSTDADVVIAALAKSTEQLMEVSEDGKKVRRTPTKPLPIMNDERKKELMSRTVYVKGFPLTNVTLDNGLEYFAPYGPIENIQMRSYNDRATSQSVFKGSVFVMFKTVEGAKKFMELESVKYEDKELIRKWQADYFEEKRQERDLKKSKGKSETSTVKDAAPETELPKGCVLHFKGLSEGNEVTRELIKQQLVKLGVEVAFVDFSKGDTELHVRFHKENSAKNLLSEHMAEGKFNLCDCDVEVQLLEGEEEETFLAKTKQNIANSHSQSRFHGNSRGRGRGGRGGGRGRGGRGGQKRRGSPNRSDDRHNKKRAV